MAYTKALCDSVQVKTAVGATHEAESALIALLCEKTDSLHRNCIKLQKDLEHIPASTPESVHYCRNIIVADMEAVRADADVLEALTDKSYWPYPTYSDLLFY